MKTSLTPYIIAGLVAAYLYSTNYKAEAALLAAVVIMMRLSFMFEARIDQIERRLDGLDQPSNEDHST
jgi:hypothetical protein